MNEYIDVRGPWPVYFNGYVGIELVGMPRNVTLFEAQTRVWALRTYPNYPNRVN